MKLRSSGKDRRQTTGLIRQQYLMPSASVKKLRELSEREGISVNEIVRNAIEAYASGSVITHSDEVAAQTLLSDIHHEVCATLKRIDDKLKDLRKFRLRSGNQASHVKVRRKVIAWIEAHPDQARTIAALFAQDDA